MLESLYIHNFAIIDDLQIDFEDHMTVLTGETGAGKSIIIHAIGQLCGDRTSIDYIKKGKDQAVIEGIFAIDKKIEQLLEEYHVPCEDSQLVVSKTIRNDGKATLKMNYKNVTQIVLKKVMPHLIDIHSQFETHQLFDQKKHIQILDHFIGKPLYDIKKQYTEVYQKMQMQKKEYDALSKEELSDEQLDFYQTQLSEINEINFDDFDEDYLFAERKRLADFEKNKHHFEKFYAYIDGNHGVLTLLKDSLTELSYVDDSEVNQIHDQLYDLYYTVSELHSKIQDIEASNNFDEDYFEEIQNTYFTFNKLKRKYGQTIESILHSKEELERKIENFNNRDAILNDLETQIQLSMQVTEQLAAKMSELRQTQAVQLENQIMTILKQLYLPHVQLKFSFFEQDLTANGKDLVIIEVSTNVGQELKPLQKIASGGELSRIMLAIKTVCNQFNDIDTIIFDEADTGVSGKVAESIGQIMKDIADKQQVLCITHLAQVAGFADQHLYIQKTENKDTTSVSVTELNESDSIKELAKMISGANITKESLEHAKALKK